MTSERVKIDLIANGDSNPPKIEFDKIIGQENVIKKLQFYLSTYSLGSVFPTMLFTGSHGLGKTYVAGLLAKNMGRRFLEINCSAIESSKDFIESILLDKVMGQTPVTILLDEAHKLSSDVTTLLLSLLATSDNKINTLEYRGWEICYDLTKINTILATTDSFKIFPPLIDRCETIYFSSYANPEIIKMLQFYLPNIDLLNAIDKNVLEEMAYACRGRGRDTYALAQKIKRQCGSKGVFNDSDWNSIKCIFGIYPMGLNEQEVNLLRIVRIAGVISCSNIAARMMIGESNISEEIEIRPKELWLLNNTTRGRVLTDRGEEYFDKYLLEDKQQSEIKLKGGLIC